MTAPTTAPMTVPMIGGRHPVGVAGFGLVELSVVLALLAILLAAAWPSWQSHLQRNRRLDATGALMQIGRAHV